MDMAVTHRRQATGFKPGDLVLVQPRLDAGSLKSSEWWMGWIVQLDPGPRPSVLPSTFQVADCDTGALQWVHADDATRLVLSGMNADVVPMI